MAVKGQIYLWLALLLLLGAQILAWSDVRNVRAHWANVPPVPNRAGFTAFSLGDPQFAYRIAGLMLQNLGNTGGRTEKFEAYDYDRLGQWFQLSRNLDDESNFVPFLAAYYFSAVEGVDRLKPLVNYLEFAGQDKGIRKWQWLAQATYLSRYKIKDMNEAYRLANMLAALPDPSLPYWAKQMPAFVLMDSGDKKAAYDIMVEILKSSRDTMPVEEVNFMLSYICTRILDAEGAKTDPLCEGGTW